MGIIGLQNPSNINPSEANEPNSPSQPNPNAAPPLSETSNYHNDLPVRNTSTHYQPEKLYGLSERERMDPNEIQITLADKETPVVVLFGPPASGKTMMLIRLTRWLQRNNYTVTPVRSFRPSTDQHYKDLCDNFNKVVASPSALASTDVISFMLLKVEDSRHHPICQILEAPGEHYFDPGNPNAPYPGYVNSIINSDNPKIWLLMLEPHWMDFSDRTLFLDRIRQLRRMAKMSDKYCLVLNKIDLSNAVISKGVVDMTAAKREFGELYPGIYEIFRNQNPITSIIYPFKADMTVFQSGTFTDTVSGPKSFQEGPNEYVQRLWEKIRKYSLG